MPRVSPSTPMGHCRRAAVSARYAAPSPPDRFSSRLSFRFRVPIHHRGAERAEETQRREKDSHIFFLLSVFPLLALRLCGEWAFEKSLLMRESAPQMVSIGGNP